MKNRFKGNEVMINPHVRVGEFFTEKPLSRAERLRKERELKAKSEKIALEESKKKKVFKIGTTSSGESAVCDEKAKISKIEDKVENIDDGVLDIEPSDGDGNYIYTSKIPDIDGEGVLDIGDSSAEDPSSKQSSKKRKNN